MEMRPENTWHAVVVWFMEVLYYWRRIKISLKTKFTKDYTATDILFFFLFWHGTNNILAGWFMLFRIKSGLDKRGE